MAEHRVDPQLDPHGDQSVLIDNAGDSRGSAILLLHGRGATASSILDLGRALGNAIDQMKALLIAPQAAGGSWYPGSFLEPLDRNQPWLDSALAKVAECSNQLTARGFGPERQIVAGFSQGACLASEFMARHPRRYGALFAFTGGVLGPLGAERTFSGDLEGTPVLLSSGDPDPHVPFVRVEESAKLFQRLGARVELERHVARPHTILPEEIAAAARLWQREADTPS